MEGNEPSVPANDSTPPNQDVNYTPDPAQPPAPPRQPVAVDPPNKPPAGYVSEQALAEERARSEKYRNQIQPAQKLLERVKEVGATPDELIELKRRADRLAERGYTFDQVERMLMDGTKGREDPQAAKPEDIERLVEEKFANYSRQQAVQQADQSRQTEWDRAVADLAEYASREDADKDVVDELAALATGKFQLLESDPSRSFSDGHVLHGTGHRVMDGIGEQVASLIKSRLERVSETPRPKPQIPPSPGGSGGTEPPPQTGGSADALDELDKEAAALIASMRRQR